ncbi:MAG: hypothetical protein R3F05_20015 [Planctomycetota bacterium]
MSPAVNDPGTAINDATRHDVSWSTGPKHVRRTSTARSATSTYVERVGTVDVLRDAFGAIGRDGAAHRSGDPPAEKPLPSSTADHGALGPAAAGGREAFERSDQGLRFEPERDLLKQVHESLGWSPRS